MATFHDPRDHEFDGCLLASNRGPPPRGNIARVQKYGLPILMGEEAKEEGLNGFGGILYCSVCDQRFDFLLIDFVTAGVPSRSLGGEIDLEEWNEDFMRCPHCGHRDLVLEPL